MLPENGQAGASLHVAERISANNTGSRLGKEAGAQPKSGTNVPKFPTGGLANLEAVQLPVHAAEGDA
jgi:hypothetical protein